MDDEVATRAMLNAEKAATLARVHAMAAEFDEIVAASADANGDDEHDPEGATVAFERARVDALVRDARGYLDRLDRALSRLDAGRYGACQRCGGPIAPERLEALPGATVCITCATAP
jgi:DnaK suppressor protein